MSLRFFSDQCVPAEITDILRRHGHQVTLLREVLPICSLDPAVIGKAQELGAILLSLNGDFADIVGYPPANFLLNGFLDEVYATLVVRLHHTDSFHQDQLWRDAVDFEQVAAYS